MAGRKGSGIALAAVIGLLTLAPAPAAAAGVGVAPGKDAVDAAAARPTLGIAGSIATQRRVPVQRRPADFANAPAKPSTGKLASRPAGIGPDVQMSPTPTTDRFSSTAVAVDPNDATGKHLTAASNFTTNTVFETYDSTDGGATWSTAGMGNSNNTSSSRPSRVSRSTRPAPAATTRSFRSSASTGSSTPS